MSSRLAVLAIVMVLPAMAAAQSRPVDTGSRVRVTAPNAGLKKYPATIVAIRGDSIVLGAEGLTRTIAVAELKRIDVSTGMGTNLVRYANIGAGIGVVGGAIIGAVTYEKCVPQGLLDCMLAPDDRGEAAFIAGAIGGVLGMAVGAFAGATHKTEQWKPARLPLQVAVVPSPSGGVRVVLSPRRTGVGS